MAGAKPSGLSKKHSQAGGSAAGPDWLSPTILAARAITAAGECLPFLYVKGAFGIVVVFLETVEVHSTIVPVKFWINDCRCRK
jgi:hypothetical protein